MLRKKVKRILKNILKIAFYPMLHTFRFFSYLFPRKDNIWLFGSYSGLFNDNAKYIYIYIYENHPDIKAIWISKKKEVVKFLRDRNFRAYHKWSIKGIFYCLVGKVYFYNSYLSDINTWFHGKAIKVNLWHGVPIKKIEFDISGEISYKFKNHFINKFLYPNHYIKPDYVLSTSKIVSKFFSSAFRVDISKCIEFGYPRNEILKWGKSKVIEFIKKYEPTYTLKLIEKLKNYKKVYIYMPTWRDNGRDFIKEANINFEKLEELLRKKNYILLLKLHPNTNLPLNIFDYKNITLIDNKIDIYPILPFTDVLITDYSSIYFDYKIMNKDVIFFCFDKDKYIKERGFYVNYEEIIKYELSAKTFDELISFIENDKKLFPCKNPIFENFMGQTKNINSSDNIVKYIKKKIKYKDKFGNLNDKF